MRMTKELSGALEQVKTIVEARGAHILRTADMSRSEREILT